MSVIAATAEGLNRFFLFVFCTKIFVSKNVPLKVQYIRIKLTLIFTFKTLCKTVL